MAIDLPCSHCGREPSHPQIQHQFVWAAYYSVDLALVAGQKRYVAALCGPCFEADRRAKTHTAQNRFLGRVRRWSAQAENRDQIVRLVGHPEGISGVEQETDTCFRAGEAIAYSTLVVPAKAPKAASKPASK